VAQLILARVKRWPSSTKASRSVTGEFCFGWLCAHGRDVGEARRRFRDLVEIETGPPLH
jgi:hypothetical protein